MSKHAIALALLFCCIAAASADAPRFTSVQPEMFAAPQSLSNALPILTATATWISPSPSRAERSAFTGTMTTHSWNWVRRSACRLQGRRSGV